MTITEFGDDPGAAERAAASIAAVTTACRVDTGQRGAPLRARWAKLAPTGIC